MGIRGVKRPHPLGSVPSRSGASQLTAESGVASVTVPGVKISALPAASGGTGSDQFEVNQSGTSRRITTAQLATALPPVDWSSITGKPTSMPPNGPASGDLAGTYPAPTIKPSATNGQVLTTVAGVSTWATSTAGSTVIPEGSVAYGGVGGVVTGVLADFAWDSTNKRLGVGTATPGALAHFNSATAGTKALIVRGTTTSASQDYFDVVLTDPTGGGGSAMRVMGGPTGINPLFQVDRAGDTQVSGWLRVLSTSGLVTNGADYFGAMLGNGAGGNLGTFAGLGAPTFSTFGSYGAIYLNGSSPGLPYYNNNGTTGWDRLVGESSTQTLTNKTLGTGTVLSGYLPLGGGTLTGPLTGTTATFSGSGQTASNPSTSTGLGGSVNLLDTEAPAVGAGGMLMFASQLGNMAAIKGYLTNGGSNTQGDIIVATRRNGTDATLTETARFKFDGSTILAGAITATQGTFTGALSGGTTTLTGALNGTTATFTGTVFAPGAQIQMVSVETGAVATGTTIIPFDDTIPQQTEGDQYMTLAITPKSATSKLIIEVAWNGSSTTAGETSMAAALFQDAAANALAAIWTIQGATGKTVCLNLMHVMTSGTTSATTFKVRVGSAGAGTTTFNGSGGARFFGGVMASSIVIREVAP